MTDGGLGNICKANIRVGEIQQFCRLQDEGRSLMRAVMTQLNLSARAYHRILKLSRTIADLVRGEGIQSAHLAEALHASQSSKDHDRVIILIELNWIILNGEA